MTDDPHQEAAWNLLAEYGLTSLNFSAALTLRNDMARLFLEQLVGCDCDNGPIRRDKHMCGLMGFDYAKGDRCPACHAGDPCDRCVLVEVGGIQMRVRAIAWTWHSNLAHGRHLMVPVTEVGADDDR